MAEETECRRVVGPSKWERSDREVPPPQVVNVCARAPGPVAIALFHPGRPQDALKRSCQGHGACTDLTQSIDEEQTEEIWGRKKRWTQGEPQIRTARERRKTENEGLDNQKGATGQRGERGGNTQTSNGAHDWRPNEVTDLDANSSPSTPTQRVRTEASSAATGRCWCGGGVGEWNLWTGCGQGLDKG